MTPEKKIFVALPLMDEIEYLPSVLKSISNQNFGNFEVFICVNQPDKWWEDKEKINVCLRNAETILKLEQFKDFPVHVIDKSSPGKGWDDKYYGVGWARKTVMDTINNVASKNDILLTLDGDTTFGSGYFTSIADGFISNPEVNAISVPYYHPLTGNHDADRAILRYEIYMRYYAINLLRIGNPFAFTALGSAIACKVSAYRSIGGITPHKSGEDFYFLQKLRKFGPILIDHPQAVHPASRFSDRVFFGTGPAMIKGASGDWLSYPVYEHTVFDEVKVTFESFEKLFRADIKTPMSAFLQEKFKTDSIWQPLRENFKTAKQFIRACQHKVDGLRILQFIKWRPDRLKCNDEGNLFNFLQYHYPNDPLISAIDWNNFSFEFSEIEVLETIRDSLAAKEKVWQQKIKILK